MIWSPVRAGSRDLGRGRSNERLRSVLSPVDGSTFPFFDAEHSIHKFHLSWESGLSSGSATASKNLESAPRNTWWPRFWLSLIHSFKYPTILMDKWSIITLIILRDVAIPLVPFKRVQAPTKSYKTEINFVEPCYFSWIVQMISLWVFHFNFRKI